MQQLQIHTSNSTESNTLFADVILPVPIPKAFTYKIPEELNDALQIGYRVIVPFGKHKVITGIIKTIHREAPEQYEARDILDILDTEPIVNPLQIELMQWIADYYMCTIGEVMNNMIPTGLKLSSESRVQLNPNFNNTDSEFELSTQETTILNNLQNDNTLSYKEIGQLLNLKNIYRLIKSLVSKEAIIIFEEIKEKYKPKIESRVRLIEKYLNEAAIQELFSALEKKAKQTDILLKYLQEVDAIKNNSANDLGLTKKVFKEEGLSISSLQTLIKNQVFESFEHIVSRFENIPIESQPVQELTDLQAIAKQEIMAGFDQNKPVLLHGITGSGKTAIYSDLIREVLDSGHQVLYLVPEIALTTQIVARLRKVFGNEMGVYHSKFSDNERIEVWNGILSGKFSFVVGVRSAVFLPFDNLGLIVIDEEHETSYKQHDPAPRYNARDVAIYLATKNHAKVLLGSATPSVETYHHAINGKYHLVTLDKRFGGASLPETVVVDLIRARKRKKLKNDFTEELLDTIINKINIKEQSIIFQNRRGYAPLLNCEQCGWIPQCENCSVSLTYHLYKNELRCHYCGFNSPVPSKCNACESTELKNIGFGTEKIEEDLTLFIPEARIQRMDLDTTRNKYGYQRIIDNFESGSIDILVGTQMVTKGLDFDNVSLVGVLDIDRMLYYPDFRAFERTFQMITQVSGRAGRKDKKGTVVIQTAQPEQPVLQYIINNDYLGFYQKEIEERERFKYPPFHRLITITIKNKDKDICNITAVKLANLLVEQFGQERILGPQEPGINRVRNQYLMRIMIKIERKDIALQKFKAVIKHQAETIRLDKVMKSSRIIFDVDPYY
jgi:primosomal protein N' (replication factor Y)